MNRRDFLRYSSLSTLPLLSFSNLDTSTVSLKINIYETGDVNINEDIRKKLKINIAQTLKTLDSKNTKVKPIINFITDPVILEDDIGRNNKNIEWTEEVYFNNPGDYENADSNILLLDNKNADANGSAILGCPVCIFNTGVINTGKNLERFNSENIDVNNVIEYESYPERSFVTLMHEIGHTLGLRHDDGDYWLNENDEVVSTIMTTFSDVRKLRCVQDKKNLERLYCDKYRKERVKLEYNEDINTAVSRMPSINRKELRKEAIRYIDNMDII